MKWEKICWSWSLKISFSCRYKLVKRDINMTEWVASISPKPCMLQLCLHSSTQLLHSSPPTSDFGLPLCDNFHVRVPRPLQGLALPSFYISVSASLKFHSNHIWTFPFHAGLRFLDSAHRCAKLLVLISKPSQRRSWTACDRPTWEQHSTLNPLLSPTRPCFGSL